MANLDPLIIGTAEECWPWGGAKNNQGYGTVSEAGRPTGVHRLVYEIAVGPIPEGHYIDHLCENKACANPSHMEPVLPSVNILRGSLHNAKKTHCPKGHPYDLVHTWRSKERGRVFARRCSICRKEQERKRWSK